MVFIIDAVIANFVLLMLLLLCPICFWLYGHMRQKAPKIMMGREIENGGRRIPRHVFISDNSSYEYGTIVSASIVLYSYRRSTIG